MFIIARIQSGVRTEMFVHRERGGFTCSFCGWVLVHVLICNRYCSVTVTLLFMKRGLKGQLMQVFIDGKIRLISWNVRGMNSSVKRGKIFKHLKSLKGDVYFLQETHIKKTDIRLLQPVLASQVYQSNFSA